MPPPHHHPHPHHGPGGREHDRGYVPYPSPAVDDLARFLGEDWASILARVLGQAPSEQAGIADLIVGVALDLQERLDNLSEQVANLAAGSNGHRDEDVIDDDDVTDTDEVHDHVAPDDASSEA